MLFKKVHQLVMISHLSFFNSNMYYHRKILGNYPYYIDGYRVIYKLDNRKKISCRQSLRIVDQHLISDLSNIISNTLMKLARAVKCEVVQK